MKCSKLFLGITTGILAIAGIAASKASHFTPFFTVAYYCTKEHHTVCVPTLSICTNTGNVFCKIVKTPPWVLYTLCSYTPSGTDGCLTFASRCARAIRYVDEGE